MTDFVKSSKTIGYLQEREIQACFPKQANSSQVLKEIYLNTFTKLDF